MALIDTTKLQVLAQLAKTIAARRNASPETSYTARLMSKGPAKCGQKTGEEAVELVIAVASGETSGISSEAADVLYHLLVTLEVCDVAFDDVLDELARRKGIGGLEEKASRGTRDGKAF